MIVRTGSQCRAMTVIEVLITMALLGLVLSALGSIFVLGYRVSTERTNNGYAFRQTTIAIDQMSRELRMCQHVYCPTSATLAAGFWPRMAATSPLIFVRWDADRQQNLPVGYTQDSSSHEIVRMIYSPSFDPSTPAAWLVTGVNRFGASVQSLRFTEIAESGSQYLLQIDLTLAQAAAMVPLGTSVHVQGP